MDVFEKAIEESRKKFEAQQLKRRLEEQKK